MNEAVAVLSWLHIRTTASNIWNSTDLHLVLPQFYLAYREMHSYTHLASSYHSRVSSRIGNAWKESKTSSHKIYTLAFLVLLIFLFPSRPCLIWACRYKWKRTTCDFLKRLVTGFMPLFPMPPDCNTTLWLFQWVLVAPQGFWDWLGTNISQELTPGWFAQGLFAVKLREL